MLNILILDDNFEFVETLFNELNKNENKYKITKICTDSKKSLKYILNDSFDVILLDLNMPNLNGLQILDIIKKNNLKCYVIVISGDTNHIVELVKGNFNIYKIFTKPFNINELRETLNKLYDFENNSKDNVTLCIEDLLNEYNFNKSSIGYSYIIDCLKICIKKNYRHIPNMKLLYKIIAEKENIVTPSNIGWNIEKCINTMRKCTDEDIIKKYFCFLPSPKLFLNTILSKYYLKNNKTIH